MQEYTMLIVDDNEVNREILALLFKERFLILTASTGKEALEILEGCDGKINIVLLDLMMPELDGMDVLRKRSELDYFRDVPVVVITASTNTDDQVKAFELNADDFVTKPFVPEIVASRVNNVMAAHQRMSLLAMETERMKQKAETDQMTGLYNKSTTEQMISQVLTKNADHMHAMLVVDIDNFKAVNDTSGHLVGDHTIRIVAETLAAQFRKSDVIGRIGGDEFVVLMTNIPSMDIVRKKVHELIQIMKYKPNLTIPSNITLSVGFAQSTRETRNYEELFLLADEALYHAKKDGKARSAEYGRTDDGPELDTRSTIIMLGRSRSVSNVVSAFSPQELKVVEVMTPGELAEVSRDNIDKLLLSYVDVSDQTEDSRPLWPQLNEYPWLLAKPIVAICAEGNITQMKEALLCPSVTDIMSTPVEPDMFKRRIERQLQQLKSEP